MLVLFETQAGYAVFKLLDNKKLEATDNLFEDFLTPQGASKVVTLKHFQKFIDTTEALAATTSIVEGKLPKSLRKTLKTIFAEEAQETLCVYDAKLGASIKEKLQISCISNSSVQELMRCIKTQAESLIGGLPKQEMAAMALGLSHSLARYKLKFSPDKIDTMIVQAVSLLDDLDKELNNYVMRCREWYGWHFPEMGKIVTDNLAFVRTVQVMGMRTNAATTDMSEVLPEEIEQQVKEAAEISMGTEISEQDITNISHLCEQVTEITEYRAQLYDYLKSRMNAIAPNLTVLVGELVGARLIAHAGTLMNLAKHPASTVQILGAEKALFRALKTKHDTPKYGLIYHAQLVGQAGTKLKGKMSRMLAAKAALATRVDALGDDVSADLGAEHRAKLEARLRVLEQGGLTRLSGTGKQKAKFDVYQNKSEVRQYPTAADSTLPTKRKMEAEAAAGTPKRAKIEEVAEPVKEEEVPKKEKKKKKKKEEAAGGEEAMEVAVAEPAAEGEKKKKKKKEKKSKE